MAIILFQILVVLAIVSLLALIERGDAATRRMRAIEVRVEPKKRR